MPSREPSIADGVRPSSRFESVLERACELGLRDEADPRWVTVIHELLPTLHDCEAFVAWAREHPRWSFNVADVTANVCAKPREAAVAVLADVVAERLDEDA